MDASESDAAVVALAPADAATASGDHDEARDPCEGDARLGALTALCTHPLVTELRELPATRAGTRAFTFQVTQLVDHADPARGTFPLRVQLLHRDEHAPTVFQSTGYSLRPSSPADSELSYQLRGNAVAVEHRFFGPSTPLRGPGGQPPPPDAWKYLTIAQAAADNHRVIQVLKPIYDRAWVSTGASKGGMTSVYHRRFYPEDVDGTVAYVAPHSHSPDDPRYQPFLAKVGNAQCRAAVLAFQRAALSRRAELLPLAEATARGLTFEQVGSIEAALEHAVQEFRFAFFQYGTEASCQMLPAPTADAADLYDTLTRRAGGMARSSDRAHVASAYYYQAATQLGQYGPLEDGLTDLLHHPGTYTVDRYAPRIPGMRFDPSPMRDVQEWLLERGDHFIFVYGEYDPWTAAAYATPTGRDVHTYMVPGGNHGASLTDPRLPEARRDEARAILARWTGVLPPLTRPLPEPQLLPWVHLPEEESSR